ncbi:hypothetical protein F511_41329 [Dorcoceras hygrometricum]|uniref:Uncharacterized protein n=1 Tax=Dorcoceras hygrometricum TaxID=472368 RepID=A0A2Z7CNM9_9LAMI|nr:hypothetical protein F511_41329 [Dorcoceras hygrometricum]
MALVFIKSALQVNFKSVLDFPNQGMVKMFKALESSGIKGFLRPSAAKVKRLEDVSTRADAFVQPAVKRKRTTIGRAAAMPKTLRVKQYPPSVTTRNPITEIRWSQGIHIRDVNCQGDNQFDFADIEFFVKSRDSIFFRVRDHLQLSGFEQPKWLRDRFKVDATKLLRWTEMDSIRVAFKRRLMVQAKLGELFLCNVLLERRKKCVPRHPLASIDLQVLDVLAEAHRIAVVAYLGLRKQHKLAIPDAIFRAFQHGQRAKQFSGFFEAGTHADLSSPACESIEMVYEEIHPAQSDRSFSDCHSVSSFAQIAAQLRDLADLSSEITSARLMLHEEAQKQLADKLEPSLPQRSARRSSILRELVMSKRGKVVAAAEKGRVAVLIDTETTVGSTDGLKDCF